MYQWKEKRKKKKNAKQGEHETISLQTLFICLCICVHASLCNLISSSIGFQWLTRHGVKCDRKSRLRINVQGKKVFKGHAPFCYFMFAQNHVNGALVLFFLTLWKAWSIGAYTYPWLASKSAVVLTIILVHYHLGFAIHECGRSFLSGMVCNI